MKQSSLLNVAGGGTQTCKSLLYHREEKLDDQKNPAALNKQHFWQYIKEFFLYQKKRGKDKKKFMPN